MMSAKPHKCNDVLALKKTRKKQEIFEKFVSSPRLGHF